MAIILANNANGNLARSITEAATSIQLQTGQGARFPNPTGGDFFPVTLVRVDGQLEICYCTARSGDVLTVTRAREITTAKTFSAGDRVSLRLTSGVMQTILDVVNTLGVDGISDSESKIFKALKRSYAYAGLNLVEGSFEEGGVLSVASDVMITASGNGYSWGGPEFPHNVAPGTDPATVGSGYVPRTDVTLLDTEPAVVTPYITAAATPRDGFQAAINAGSVRVPSGSNITISGDINIPANRVIIVDFGATITSNGRFTAYGVNNVHWVINGAVLSAGMTAAPAKSGWPNTAHGTQNGDERGFLEFGGVTFSGNDGANYSVRIGETGVVAGDWVGTPNFSDPVRQVNRKGIAAWNCSNVHFESDGEIYGFEGEAVYWRSSSAAGKNVYMRAKNIHDCRFNGLNVNALLATENIKIEKSVTKNTYHGVEASAGDVLDCRDYSSVKHAVYAGQGHGGGGRRISGNLSFDCLDVPFAILYNAAYQSLGRIADVVFTDNHAFDPAAGFIAIADIENIQAHGNTCKGLKAGRFIQVTGCEGGAITGNTNFNPAVGTEHYYEAGCYSLFKENNKKISLGGSYNVLMKANDDFTGGLNSNITTHGNRENFVDARATNPDIATGPEYRFSYDQTLPFVAATIGANLTGYDASGAKADVAINNLKIGTGDTLGPSWIFRSAGHLEPSLDGFSNVGSPAKRANTIYAAAGTINTSDEREKIRLEIVDAERNAALEIKQNMWKFQFKVSNSEKNGNGRFHFGVGAQTVGEIMKKHGLDPSRYSFFCYDEWDEEMVYAVDDDTKLPTGESVTITKSGNRYGIRYDELLCFIISAM